MISFPKLGSYGRLGNQMFQYAFLRSTAERLNTNFYCPPWEGDSIFELGDEKIRAAAPKWVTDYYVQPKKRAGFLQSAFEIKDNTEVLGFFQSEKYFVDHARVRTWFKFKESIMKAALEKVAPVDPSECTVLSLRIDDDYNSLRSFFPFYPLSFYEKGISILNPQGPFLIVPDRPDRAQVFFEKLSSRSKKHILAIHPWEKLALMSLCEAHVTTNSTFCWWGAWLSPGSRKGRVVAPIDWCRHGLQHGVQDILSDDWIKINGTNPLLGHIHVWRAFHPFETWKAVKRKVTELLGP